MRDRRPRAAGRRDLAESILDIYSEFCSAVFLSQPDAWLFVDLTMPQIKALYLVVTLERTTGSRLAQGLGIGLPSVTRFVDRLAERGLVARAEDPRDRRVTHIVPTSAGQQVIESLLSYRREYVRAALAALDIAQLREVERGLSHLLVACRRQSEPAEAESVPVAANGARQGQEVD